MCITHLQDEGKLEVLMALLSKKISWSEASNRISEIKAPPTMRESTTEEPQPSQFKVQLLCFELITHNTNL